MNEFEELLSQNEIDEEKLQRDLAARPAADKNYVVWFTPRTGSSWLGDLLNSTGKLGYIDEWYNTIFLKDFAKGVNTNSLESYTKMLKRYCRSENGVFGVEITYFVLQRVFPDALTNPQSLFFQYYPRDIPAFALFRKDIVSQAVSLYRATESQVFSSLQLTDEERKRAEEQFYYDAPKINHWLRHIRIQEEGMMAFFKKYGIDPTILVYEDYIYKDPSAVAKFFCDRICPGTELPETEIQSRHKKLGTSKNDLFAQRFKLDNRDLVKRIEDERQAIFARATPIPEKRHDTESGAAEVQALKEKIRQPLTMVPEGQPAETDLSVIVPVYAGLQQTKDCLRSVLAAGCETQADLIVIYDKGPEREVERYLDVLAGEGLISLHKNEENLGFVKTVNRGFELAGRKDCVILNSDTVVPHGWLDRIAALADTDPQIATITPFTNNGEIASFPDFCRENILGDGRTVEQVDAIFQNHVETATIDLPTGVGFCMYVRRAGMDAVGPFDEESFGKGYGEENDLSARLNRAGFRNVLQTNLFVYHEGGASFGAEKAQRLEEARKILSKLHPALESRIWRHIIEDPAGPYRYQALLAMLGTSDKPSVLLVSHGLGGGTKRYIEELQAYFGEHMNFLLLEPVTKDRYRLSFPQWASGSSLEFETGKDDDLLVTFLSAANIDLVHVNHTMGVGQITKRIIEELSLEFLVTLHDYFFIADTPSLTDGAGMYEPERYLAKQAGAYLAGEDKFSRKIQLSDWMLRNAKRVIAPSESAADIYRGFFPGLAIECHGHIDSQLIGEYPPVVVKDKKENEPFRIAILGALGPEKGADLLERTAKVAAGRDLDIEFHLIGYAYRDLASCVITHGEYDDENIHKLIRHVAPDLIWFPCHWPETYSYTLSAALESSAPVLVPDLGAFKCRTAGRPMTWRIPHDLSAQDYVDEILKCRAALAEKAGETLHWEGQPAASDFYLSSYRIDRPDDNRHLKRPLPTIAELQPLLKKQSTREAAVRTAVLRLLLRLRSNPYLGGVLRRFVPIGLQKSVRQFLTRAPSTSL